MHVTSHTKGVVPHRDARRVADETDRDGNRRSLRIKSFELDQEKYLRKDARHSDEGRKSTPSLLRKHRGFWWKTSKQLKTFRLIYRRGRLHSFID